MGKINGSIVHWIFPKARFFPNLLPCLRNTLLYWLCETDGQ
jgi:hypothetical protein